LGKLEGETKELEGEVERKERSKSRWREWFDE
jgi:hypothetical protein